MVRWRNVFAGLLVLAWVHGLASAILYQFELRFFGTFAASVAVLALAGLLPAGFCWSEQSDGYLLERAEKAEAEVKRLSAELVERDK